MRYIASCILAVASLPAQTSLVSPAAFANVEAPGWNFAPCATPTSRYMQIHSDLGASPRVIRKIALRREGSITTGIPLFSLTVDLYLGTSRPFDAPSWRFANNFVGTRMQVVTRKVFDLQARASTAMPAPFEIAFAFDVPYLFPGGTSLAWQLDLPGNIGSSQVGAMDAFAPPASGSLGTSTGRGCFPSGLDSQIMEHLIGACDSGGRLSLGGIVTCAQPYSPVVLSLGLSDPNLSIPGLCSPLRTDLTLVLPLGVSDWSGFVGASRPEPLLGGPFGFGFPNVLPGSVIYSQAHCLDAGRTDPIKIANSNGHALRLPQITPGDVQPVTRLWMDNLMSPNAVFVMGSNIGYGLVTEFSF